jgi:site-specific DNA-methyltransferase (adenine-specific)
MLRYRKDIKGRRNSDNWATPLLLYRQLSYEFRFTFDPCPLCAPFDGLKMDWIGSIFINPPYSNIPPFIEKGLSELTKGNAQLLVYLIPIRSDVRYWHELILPNLSELRFIRGRLHFNESKAAAPCPVVLVVFRKDDHTMKLTSYEVASDKTAHPQN